MVIINMFTSMDLNTGSCALNSGGSALATDREEMREQIQKNLSLVYVWICQRHASEQFDADSRLDHRLLRHCKNGFPNWKDANSKQMVYTACQQFRMLVIRLTVQPSSWGQTKCYHALKKLPNSDCRPSIACMQISHSSPPRHVPILIQDVKKPEG